VCSQKIRTQQAEPVKKTLVLAILGVTAVRTASYGQGLVYFSNYFTDNSPTINYAASVTPSSKDNLALGGSFYAELFYYNGVTSNANLVTNPVVSSITYFSLAGPGENSTPDGDSDPYTGEGAGWFFGGIVTLPFAGGTEATFLVYVQNDADTFAGTSALFNMTSGEITPPYAPPANLNQASGNNYQYEGAVSYSNFTVTNVPEPATMSLVCLGTAGLLALRRRK
jgi:hypothetical protein